SALDASILGDELEAFQESTYSPVPRVFLTINSFVEQKHLSDKKWGVSNSAVVASNGVVETALFFDADKRRLVAAELPLCGTGSRREVPLVTSNAYVVDPMCSTIVKEGEAAEAPVEAICQHPNKLDVFATTNGQDVVVWCWHGDQPGGKQLHGELGLPEPSRVLQTRCVIPEMLGEVQGCIRLMTFLPHGNRVLLVTVVEVRNTLGDGGALRHILRLDEVLPQRSSQAGNHYKTRKPHHSVELRTAAVRVAVAATVGVEEFAMEGVESEDGSERQVVDVRQSLTNPFRVLVAGLSGRTLLVGGRNVLQIFEVVELPSSEKKEERRLRLIADCVKDYDDFEDIDVSDCLPVLPEQQRPSRASQEGMTIVDRYLVSCSSGQVVSLVASSQRQRSTNRSSAGPAKESLMLDVSKSSIVVTATEAATPHVRSIVCPWKSTQKGIPASSGGRVSR
ncbi:hypothetical protein FOL47_001167, partial [Perkinsus chesapeaki]